MFLRPDTVAQTGGGIVSDGPRLRGTGCLRRGRRQAGPARRQHEPDGCLPVVIRAVQGSRCPLQPRVGSVPRSRRVHRALERLRDPGVRRQGDPTAPVTPRCRKRCATTPTACTDMSPPAPTCRRNRPTMRAFAGRRTRRSSGTLSARSAHASAQTPRAGRRWRAARSAGCSVAGARTHRCRPARSRRASRTAPGRNRPRAPPRRASVRCAIATRIGDPRP